MARFWGLADTSQYAQNSMTETRNIDLACMYQINFDRILGNIYIRFGEHTKRALRSPPASIQTKEVDPAGAVRICGMQLRPDIGGIVTKIILAMRKYRFEDVPSITNAFLQVTNLMGGDSKRSLINADKNTQFAYVVLSCDVDCHPRDWR